MVGFVSCITHHGKWETTPLKHAMKFGLVLDHLDFGRWGGRKFSLCLELEQIRDHFYYTNGGHLYSKSGLGFVITPTIAKFI